MRILIAILTIFTFFVSGCNSSNNDGDNPNTEFGDHGNKANYEADLPMGAEQISSISVSISCEVEFALNDVCADTKWLVGPNLDGGNSFLIQFSDRTGKLVDPVYDVGSKAVSLPDGSGNPAKVLNAKIKPVFDSQGNRQEGKFIAYDLDFSDGYWEVRIQHFDDSTLVEEHDFGVVEVRN